MATELKQEPPRNERSGSAGGGPLDPPSFQSAPPSVNAGGASRGASLPPATPSPVDEADETEVVEIDADTVEDILKRIASNKVTKIGSRTEAKENPDQVVSLRWSNFSRFLDLSVKMSEACKMLSSICTHFDFSHTPMTKQDVRFIMKGLGSVKELSDRNKPFEYLAFRYCNIDDDLFSRLFVRDVADDQLAFVFHSKIIDLRHNLLTDRTAETISKILHTSKIQFLDLRNNQISEVGQKKVEDAVAFCKAHNKNMVVLTATDWKPERTRHCRQCFSEGCVVC